MKPLLLLVFLIFILACSDKEPEVQLTDLTKYNMKIIPEKPSRNDEIKLVVFDDCNYHKLSKIVRNGLVIEIEKSFNGAMKWPCIIGNDTIAIGKLASCNYTVNYKLVDVVSSGPPVISFSFHLAVSR